MNCVECHRPFHWRAPGATGAVQGWCRHHEHGPNGLRCADRDACKAAAAKAHPTLFGDET